MDGLLILTTSCASDRTNGRLDVVYSTWKNQWWHRVPHRFVFGRGNRSASFDELVFDADDSYTGMPFKQQLAYKWALNTGYQYVFQGMIDTYIAVPRLLRYDPGPHDYVGRACAEGHASGGCGYLLSRHALEVLVDAAPHHTYEDLWVGRQLANAGIKLHEDLRFCDRMPVPWGAGAITCHLSRGTGVFNPEWMAECHSSFMETGVE